MSFNLGTMLRGSTAAAPEKSWSTTEWRDDQFRELRSSRRGGSRKDEAG